MGAETTFRRGTIFRHGRWLAPDSREKAVCRVTSTRNGVVYYGFGADARKAVFYASPESLLANGAEVLS